MPGLSFTQSDKVVKASSSSSEGCGSKGDLYDIGAPAVDHSRTAEGVLALGAEGSGLGTTRPSNSRDKVGMTPKAEKDANGKYVGSVCIPRIHTNAYTCYIARQQLRWTSGKPGADTADITAKTVADVTAHENAHVMVYQSVGRRISKYYGENVFKIKTKPYATEEEAKRKVKIMEQIFWLNCNTAFKTMADTYNALHLSANIRKYDGGSGKEWYEPTPDWFTSLGLDGKIQTHPVNVPVPADP
jgi:hypothetical protein